jgi:8-oxo-dGTP pyrophosphatase MutT (NUDIX family)
MSPYYASLRQRLGSELLLIPAVAAVVHDAAGRVLVQERRDGNYSLPAGAIEPGERPEDAVIREVLEETGLNVEPVELLGVFGGSGYREQYCNGDTVEYTVCLFRCVAVSGTIGGLDGESTDLHYFAPHEVPMLRTEYPRELFLLNAKSG